MILCNRSRDVFKYVPHVGVPFVDSCCGVKVTIKARSILTSYHGLTKQICLPKQTGKQQDPLSEKEPSLCSTMID